MRDFYSRKLFMEISDIHIFLYKMWVFAEDAGIIYVFVENAGIMRVY